MSYKQEAELGAEIVRLQKEIETLTVERDFYKNIANRVVFKTSHQQRVEEFMGLAEQALIEKGLNNELQHVPAKICIPSAKVRVLNGALIIEEAFELLIKGFGLRIYARQQIIDGSDIKIAIEPSIEPSIKEIADGCGDLSVVTIRALSSCGIGDKTLLKEIDDNNLAKFGEGHSIREDGKLIKPPNHQPPDIEGVLKEQGWVE